MKWLHNYMTPFGRQVFNKLGLDPESFFVNDWEQGKAPRIEHLQLGEFRIVGRWHVVHRGCIPNRQQMMGQVIDPKQIVSTRRLNLADMLVLRRAFREWQSRSVDLELVKAALAPAANQAIPPSQAAQSAASTLAQIAARQQGKTATQVQAQQTQFNQAVAAASQHLSNEIDKEIIKAFGVDRARDHAADAFAYSVRYDVNSKSARVAAHRTLLDSIKADGYDPTEFKLDEIQTESFDSHRLVAKRR